MFNELSSLLYRLSIIRINKLLLQPICNYNKENGKNTRNRIIM